MNGVLILRTMNSNNSTNNNSKIRNNVSIQKDCLKKNISQRNDNNHRKTLNAGFEYAIQPDGSCLAETRRRQKKNMASTPSLFAPSVPRRQSGQKIRPSQLMSDIHQAKNSYMQQSQLPPQVAADSKPKKSASASSIGDSETRSNIDKTKNKSLEATPVQGVKKCRYGAECRNKTCKFLHPEKKGDDNEKSTESNTKAVRKPVSDTKPSRNEKSSKIQAPKQTEKRKLSNSTGRKGKSVTQDEKEKLSNATQNMRHMNLNESIADKN